MIILPSPFYLPLNSRKYDHAFTVRRKVLKESKCDHLEELQEENTPCRETTNVIPGVLNGQKKKRSSFHLWEKPYLHDINNQNPFPTRRGWLGASLLRCQILFTGSTMAEINQKKPIFPYRKLQPCPPSAFSPHWGSGLLLWNFFLKGNKATDNQMCKQPGYDLLSGYLIHEKG